MILGIYGLFLQIFHCRVLLSVLFATPNLKVQVSRRMEPGERSKLSAAIIYPVRFAVHRAAWEMFMTSVTSMLKPFARS